MAALDLPRFGHLPSPISNLRFSERRDANRVERPLKTRIAFIFHELRIIKNVTTITMRDACSGKSAEGHAPFLL
jgi:hypothetical protein